jgi:aminoglycoside phosphotransferase (APT) family kinase protein
MRAAAAGDGERSAAASEVIRWLHVHRVPDGPSALIHNDLKLDNILLSRTTMSPVAVLDWDQGTRADALFDLATTLSYWVERDDPPAMQELRQMPTTEPGFPSRREFADTYARMTGRDLSIFKLAVIFMQLHQRYQQGATQDPRYAGFGKLADGIVEFALIVSRGELF